MRNFGNIVAGLPFGGGTQASIGDDPPLKVTYNAGSGSLIFALNAGVHITIYQNSWDGSATIADYGGHLVTVGPYCLHTTAGQERWFRQYQGNTWMWVTDYGTPSSRYLKAFSAMMNTITPYIN